MEYPYSNFYEFLLAQAQKRKRKVALFDGDRKITYGALLENVDRLASFFAANGVGEGDRVALFLRNSPEFIYTVFAVSKIGAIIVPVNTFLKEDELSYILKDSESTVLVASTVHEHIVKKSNGPVQCRFILWEGESPQSDEKNFAFTEALTHSGEVRHIARRLEDTAVLIYTSGTTGKPKGAMLSNKNLLSNIEFSRKMIKVTHKDRVIVFLPMFHAFTFTVGVILPLYVGGSIVIIKSLQPFTNVFRQTLMKRVTLFFGIPSVYNALAKAKLPWYFMWFNNIRVFISGAAPLQPKTLNAMAKKFTRAKLLEGYGLSEASPVVCVNTLEKQKAGSVGTAAYDYEIKIVDEDMNELPTGEIGDIIVKGDHIMQGYLNRPEATRETIVNGWLLTGDMGYLDDEGFLFIVDRKKDLIISKGINIYPREIEEVIDAFEGIAASAVIGVRDEKSGEIPVAYLELDEGIESINETVLKKHMREHLANFKLPKQIHIIEELPKNATGKVLKRVLKDNLRDESR
ncbi:long-chain fatty acid--CoA ligase [Sulfurovum lithotrophicum]|uniref:Long-chain fatty acid--CoA ligase n=1 Tax=Sulfurovum lithotrophicum TaxID=206403 RepID=A0A7U4LZG8_9BACT|nr:fatty acid--CoA ligase [Sulfurovum lithotrophicum]AKF24035.1 long-chain fatty acid--CoA ligase [Sulfurovum lithotrophicum]